MKVLSFVISVALVLLAIFISVNWSVLTYSTPLSFVVFTVQGPLGVILLGVTLTLVVLVVAYALMLRTSSLVESRRLHRQLEEQREVAEKAEASRLHELREQIARDLASTRDLISEASAAGTARTEQAETALTGSIQELGNTLLAHIGYVDDKLDSKPSGGGRPDAGREVNGE